ncbi:MAG: TldD/PmbA family protein [Hyphomonadaceae bacterium]
MPRNPADEALLQDLLNAARKAGAEAADASLSRRESLSIDVRLGELEGVEREEGRSVALRAMVGKRQAGATSTDLSPAGLAALVERTVAMAKAAPEDPYCGLADKTLLAASIPALDAEDSVRPDAARLEALAREAEEAALAVAGVTNSSGASAAFDMGAFAFATTHGFAGSASGTRYHVDVSPLAERDGLKERDWEGRTTRFFAELPSASEIGRIAGERTAARLGGRKIASGAAPVIFENRVAGRLIGPLLGAISGGAIARGVSFLRDKLGARIFPEGFEIEDDPLRPRGLSSRPFDGEGVAVSKRNLIEDGVLTTWLLNSAAARQLNLKTTGHATLGHGGPPGIGASNITVKPGEGDLSALMRKAGKGVLITDIFSPSLNPNTGDYSIGVAGFWFEDGVAAYPVNEITVAGNMKEMYARLVAGGDLDRRGGLDTPSLLVESMAIGGL